MAGLLGALLFGVVAVMTAQAPVTKDPHHRVVFEHPLFRILDVNVPVGATTADHTHAHDLATIAMGDGAETRTQVPGQAWQGRARRPAGHVGVSEYAGKPGTHRVQNVGTSPYHLFAVENLRESGWATRPALTARDTTLVADGRAFKVYEVQLAGTSLQIRHLHDAPSLLVLVAGRVLSQGAEVKPSTGPTPPSGLKQLDQPGQWVFAPAGEAHYVVRLGTDAARVVEVEIR